MSESDKVIRLIDRAGGYSPSDHADLCDWLANWANNLKDGKHGLVRSLVLVVEPADGPLAVVSQSLDQLDIARTVGLLQIAAQRRGDGGARINDLTP